MCHSKIFNSGPHCFASLINTSITRCSSTDFLSIDRLALRGRANRYYIAQFCDLGMQIRKKAPLLDAANTRPP